MTKDFYKKPDFYYILVPAIAVLWALYALLISLPAANERLNGDKGARVQFEKEQELLDKILTLDPDRVGYKKEKGKLQEFDFATAIERFAKQCRISPSNYTLNESGDKGPSGKKTKGANITIKVIDIENFAKFLSQMLYQWPSLTADTLTLTKQKEEKNVWKATLKLTYNY